MVKNSSSVVHLGDGGLAQFPHKTLGMRTSSHVLMGRRVISTGSDVRCHFDQAHEGVTAVPVNPSDQLLSGAWSQQGGLLNYKTV